MVVIPNETKERISQEIASLEKSPIPQEWPSDLSPLRREEGDLLEFD